MAQVREATFMLASGELKSTMQLGRQEVASNWMVDNQDANIMPLIEQLKVRIESFTLVNHETGNEIRVTMSVGGHPFVSRLPVGEQDSLHPVFTQMVDAIRRQFLRQLHTALEEEEAETNWS